VGEPVPWCSSGEKDDVSPDDVSGEEDDVSPNDGKSDVGKPVPGYLDVSPIDG